MTGLHAVLELAATIGTIVGAGFAARLILRHVPEPRGDRTDDPVDDPAVW